MEQTQAEYDAEQLRIRRMYQGRVNQKAGQFGEDIAQDALRDLGFKMVDQIHTGWKLIRWVNKQRQLAQIVPHKKVRGDRHAIEPLTGRRVLAEVKTFDGKTFTWKRLADHQRDSLLENMEFNGISLVVWIHFGRPIVMDYQKMLEAGFGQLRHTTTRKNGNVHEVRRSLTLAAAEDCVWTPSD